MLDHEVANHLRNGHLLLITQKNSIGVLGNIKSPEYSLLVEKYKSYIKKSVLLLPEIGQLSNYLQQVPELAWDIVEYAEKSLEVIYQQGRNLPDYFLNEDGSINIRVYREGVFHHFLFNQKHHIVLSIVTENFPENEFLEQYEKVLNLPETFEWKIIPDKVLSLGLNGEIKFY